MEDRPIRVLIVDDRSIMRLGIAAILRTTAAMVVVAEAGSGAEASEFSFAACYGKTAVRSSAYRLKTSMPSMARARGVNIWQC
jgi:DNA-binding NarL/FixJ family response regulator